MPAAMSDTALKKYTRQEIGIYPNTQGTSLIGFNKPYISLRGALDNTDHIRIHDINLFHVNKTLLNGPMSLCEDIQARAVLLSAFI